MDAIKIQILLEKLFLLGMQAQSNRMYQSDGIGFGVGFVRLEDAIAKNTEAKNDVIANILQLAGVA